MYSPLQINRNKGSLDRRIINPISLLETNEGDFFLSSNNDILPASQDESIAQTLTSAIKTAFDSSVIFPGFGTSLKKALGKPINVSLLDSIKTSLLSDLWNMKYAVYKDLLEVLAYDDKTLIINIVVQGFSSPRISLSYRLNTQDLTVEQLGGVQV